MLCYLLIFCLLGNTALQAAAEGNREYTASAVPPAYTATGPTAPSFGDIKNTYQVASTLLKNLGVFYYTGDCKSFWRAWCFSSNPILSEKQTLRPWGHSSAFSYSYRPLANFETLKDSIDECYDTLKSIRGGAEERFFTAYMHSSRANLYTSYRQSYRSDDALGENIYELYLTINLIELTNLVKEMQGEPCRNNSESKEDGSEASNYLLLIAVKSVFDQADRLRQQTRCSETLCRLCCGGSHALISCINREPCVCFGLCCLWPLHLLSCCCVETCEACDFAGKKCSHHSEA
ncbi:hypothetical protein EBZ39_06145 [bacterium]|nr:hypothetical protein [bacterium]